MRVLVADDQRFVLAQMVGFLEESGCEVMCQHSDGESAAVWLKEHRGEVDAMFLDVQMPGLTGLEIATYAPEVPVVFVTVYGQHAVGAFEVGAVDYLMKPVSLGKVQAAVDRVKKRFPELIFGDSVRVKKGENREIRIPLAYVDAWEVHGRILQIFVKGTPHVVIGFRTLVEVEEKWPGKYIRAGRNRIEKTDTTNIDCSVIP